MRAVTAGEIDIAIVWGPLAGYYAKTSPVPLRLRPVSPEIDLPFLPFVYDVSMGVRHGDLALRDVRRQGCVGRDGVVLELRPGVAGLDEQDTYAVGADLVVDGL